MDVGADRMTSAPSIRPRTGSSARPSGRADLPLHGGRVPEWLASRMARLGRVIVEAVTINYGRDELLRRLGHPFWFQSFGAVMGMDWHSSGITTSVLGALKRGLAPIEWELGLHVCGGRGRHSRKTPAELVAVGERTGQDGMALAQASRLVAKVDSAAVQDGFDLYLHGFILADDGSWVVVQQGMNTGTRRARRYHWLSDDLQAPPTEPKTGAPSALGRRSFVEAPHAAIEGRPEGAIVNLTDPLAAGARQAQVALIRSGPDAVVAQLRRLQQTGALPHLQLPDHHEVRASDVVLRRLHGAIAAAAERGPADFQELLLTPGIGARTVLSLALVAEVIHGAPCRFTDPARFAFAHGGKDGHPFPVPLAVYDQTLQVLRSAVDRARLGRDDRLEALRRLDAEARRLEQVARGAPFEALVAQERAESHARGGMTVQGPARPPVGAIAPRPSTPAIATRPSPLRSAPAQLELPLRR